MRDVFPVKYYRDEGFVEYKIEVDEEDLEEIIEEYLIRHAEFEFDEIEIVNNRPMSESGWTSPNPIVVRVMNVI